MVDKKRYYFVAADYFGTGEGRTVSLLITRAYPRYDDYDDSVPHGFIKGSYVKPTLKKEITYESIVVREFVNHFGDFYAIGLEFLSREQFLTKYRNFLPLTVLSLLEEAEEDDSGNFNYYSQYHINFS